MVNWKSKYLEMKLKYINSKNKIKGGMQPSNKSSALTRTVKLPFSGNQTELEPGTIMLYKRPGSGRPPRRVIVVRVRSDRDYVNVTEEDGTDEKPVERRYLTKPGGHIQTATTASNQSATDTATVEIPPKPNPPSSDPTNLLTGLVQPVTGPGGTSLLTGLIQPVTGPGGETAKLPGVDSTSAFMGPGNRPSSNQHTSTFKVGDTISYNGVVGNVEFVYNTTHPPVVNIRTISKQHNYHAGITSTVPVTDSRLEKLNLPPLSVNTAAWIRPPCSTPAPSLLGNAGLLGAQNLNPACNRFFGVILEVKNQHSLINTTYKVRVFTTAGGSKDYSVNEYQIKQIR